MSKKKENNNYVVPFKGAKLSKLEANKVGVAIIFGIVGAFIASINPFMKGKFTGLLIISISAGVGYFLIGNMIFKDKKNSK
jgi:hypothetical protein